MAGVLHLPNGSTLRSQDDGSDTPSPTSPLEQTVMKTSAQRGVY